MFNKPKEAKDKNNNIPKSKESSKRPDNMGGVKQERRDLQEKYNKSGKKPERSLWSKTTKFLSTDIGFLGSKIVNTIPVLYQAFSNPTDTNESKKTNNYQDESARINADTQKYLDDLASNENKVVKSSPDIPVSKEKIEYKTVESPNQIESKLITAIDNLKKYIENISLDSANLDAIDNEVDMLKQRFLELQNSLIDGEEGLDLVEIGIEHSEKNQERINAYKAIENKEEKIMSDLKSVTEGLKLALQNRLPVKGRSLEDRFTIEQSIIPKLQSIGISIERSASREWNVKVPVFGDIVSNIVQNQVTNNEKVKDEVVEVTEPSRSVESSKKFRLNDPKFNEAGKSRLENNYHVLQGDYESLINHFNDPENSDLNEEDLINLQNRIIYTSEKVANWKPEKIKTLIPLTADEVKSKKEGWEVERRSKIVNAPPTREQSMIKTSAFNIFGDLQKYGFKFNQDENSGNYYVTLDNSKKSTNNQVNESTNISPDLDIETVGEPSNEPEKQEVKKSKLEEFVEFTKNIKQPETQQEADILQFEIDKYLKPNLSAGKYFLLGSTLNGEFSYRLADEASFDTNIFKKVKLSLPYSYSIDDSFASTASRNIYNKLKIREYGTKPNSYVESVKPSSDSDSTFSSLEKQDINDRWGGGF